MATSLVTGLGGAAGFGENSLPVGDDISSGFIDLRQLFPRGINVFGTLYAGLFVNNNGSVSFGDPVPGIGVSLEQYARPPIIAPYLGDVDTRGGAVAATPGGSSTGGNRVWYDLDLASRTVTVTWDDVGYFNTKTDAANAFQLRLIAVPDAGEVYDGDYNMEFRYEDIGWAAKEGIPVPQAGYSAGNGTTFLRLPASGDGAALEGLEATSNEGLAGRYVFGSRDGAILPEFSVGSVRIVEGTGGAPRFAAVTIQRTTGEGFASVKYATEDGSAKAYADYLPRFGTVNFKPGLTSQTVFVQLLADAVLEGSEAFTIRLSEPSVGTTLAVDAGTVVITDDDGPAAEPTLSVADVRASESAGTMVFTVELSAPSASSLDAKFVTSGGTGASGTDFTSTQGMLTFAPGQTRATFTVPIVGDSAVEGDESFFVTVDSAANGSAIAEGTIIDDDGFIVDDVVVAEGGGSAVFTVSLLSALATDATVDFGTSSDTAGNGADYLSAGGTLKFDAGVVSRTVTVTIVSDAAAEEDERFSLVLSKASANTAIVDGKGTALIIDDDGISVGDATVTERDFVEEAVVVVTLGQAAATPVTVEWGVALGTAGFGDLVNIGNAFGQVFFGAGETKQTVTVQIATDTFQEGDETFRVVLSNPVGSTINDGSGTVTIVDNDGPIPLIVDIVDQVVSDATGDGFQTVPMTVFLNRPTDVPVSVDFALFGDTATKGDDFIDAPGTVTIAAGQTSATFDVTLVRSTVPEGDEALAVAISNATGGAGFASGKDATATLGITGYGTLFDLFLPSTVAREAEWAGGAPPVFNVERRGDLSQAQTVGWEIVLSPFASIAADAADFPSLSGSVDFAPGETTVSFSPGVVDDTAVEGNEQFSMRLVDLPAGSGVGEVNGAQQVIQNDDTVITLRGPGTPYLGLEGGGPTSSPVFRLEVEGDRSTARNVTWTITGSGATPADTADFGAMTGTVFLAANQSFASFTLSVVNDTVIEPDEGYTVTLSDPGKGATFAVASVDSVIANDDATATLKVVKATQAEGSGGGSTDYVFSAVVTPGVPRKFNAFFDWKVSAGTVPGTLSASGADFLFGNLPSGQVVVGINEVERTFTINVAADSGVELNESFTVTLFSSATGATLGTASGVILNDDARISIAATSASKPEGSGAAATPFTFTATRSGLLTNAVSAKWSVAGQVGSGTVPSTAADFEGGVLPAGTVSFAAGETSKVITVNVAADHVMELNERFAVTLGAPSAGAEIGTATAGAVVFNDDAQISIAATSASKPEGSGVAATPFTFTVTRSGLLTSAVSAQWSVAGLAGSGTVPSTAADFEGGVLPTGTVSFAAGETSKVITVNVVADRAVELNERFAVTLSAPSAGASFGTASAGAVVFNDDVAGTGTLSIARQWASRSEGQAGATDFTFLVTRSGVTTGTAAADWAVTGGTLSGTVAASATDFVGGAMAKGSVAFAAGETGKVITVQVAGDVANELNESFTVTLGNQSGGVALGTASAVGVIWNDDVAGTGTLSIARLSAQKGEGQAGTTPFTFTVTRGGVLTGTASADWSVTGGGVAGTVAATGADFVGGILPAGRVSFAAGQASAVVTVAVAGDIAAELNDGFTVTLSGAQAGVSIGTAAATGAILNDDFVSTAANQALSGTANADVFVLGGGVDTVLGIAGLDVFLYQPSALGDGVTNATFLGDFDPAAGEKLNLSAIDAIIGGGTANDTFAFIGTAAFSAAGQLRWEDQGAVRAIFGSVDADAAPELAIYVSAAGPVTAGWFVL